MQIKSLEIKGFKSLANVKLIEPSAFTVFVGPNAAGKSNIFEALEFLSFCDFMPVIEALRLFGSVSEISTDPSILHSPHELLVKLNLNKSSPTVLLESMRDSNDKFSFRTQDIGRYSNPKNQGTIEQQTVAEPNEQYGWGFQKDSDYKQFANFSRLFIEKHELVKRKLLDDSRLMLDASNLEKVLKRLLQDNHVNEAIVDAMRTFVPGFKKLEVRSSEYSSSDTLYLLEECLNRPLNKKLISDGTFNLIALLTALYQSKEPQFLCIEEPENGLNPKIVREMVTMFRSFCEDGHVIWLNTHSQTLLSELRPEEVVLVNKKNGHTILKQLKGIDMLGMRMDEAILTNSIGGGIPW